MFYSTLVLPFLLTTATAQLNDLAKAAGLKYFGTATDNSELNDRAYIKVLSNVSEFGQITPGNSQKWDAVEPNNGQFSFNSGDAIATLAENNKQLLRCHALVWVNQLPYWVTNGKWTSTTLQAVMKNHITTTMKHYKGQCYSWDVVNEAIDDSAKFRNDVFYNNVGEDYIRIAFETAAAADPDTKLYYNDYNIEYAGAKATAALAMVTKLVKAGVKIDGVGLQGHFIVGSMPLNPDFVATMEKYTALGLEVAFTEMDIRMNLPSTAASLAQQKYDYNNIVSACVKVNGCIGITIWDFYDKYSWVPGTFPGMGAPSLFDNNLNRKPAYYGVVSALKDSTRVISTTSVKSSSTIATPSKSSSSSLITASPSGMTTSYITSSRGSSTIVKSSVVPSSAGLPTSIASSTSISLSLAPTSSSTLSISTLIASSASSISIDLPSTTSSSSVTLPTSIASSISVANSTTAISSLTASSTSIDLPLTTTLPLVTLSAVTSISTPIAVSSAAITILSSSITSSTPTTFSSLPFYGANSTSIIVSPATASSLVAISSTSTSVTPAVPTEFANTSEEEDDDSCEW